MCSTLAHDLQDFLRHVSFTLFCVQTLECAVKLLATTVTETGLEELRAGPILHKAL